MMFCRAQAVATVLLGVAAFVGVARAQPAGTPLAVDSYTVDEAGTCRDDRLRLSSVRNLSYPASGIGYTFVLNPSSGLSRTSAARSEGITPALRRFEIAHVFGDDPRSGKLLVQTDQTKLCGWIEREALLLPADLRDRSARVTRARLGSGPRPVQVKDSHAKEEFPGNTLFMKVVVQNVNQAGEMRGIPLYEEAGGGKVGELSLFDIFEVFAEKNDTQPANKRKGWYYLVGKRGGEGSFARIEGWLHDEDVQMWNSRMAAFWSWQSQALGFGFSDAAEKAAMAEREGKPLPVEPVFRGPAPKQGSAPDPIAVRRFPIVAQEPGFGEGVNETKDVTWFKVAIRGAACKQPPGSTGPGKDCILSEDVDSTRMRWQKVIESMSHVDILFVVDATSSMNVYFRPVAEAVRAFTREIRKEEDVHVGVVVYGDYARGIASTETVAFERLVRLHNPITEPKAIDALAGYQKIKEDPLDNDLLEAPFAALINAAATKWRAEAGLRLIVHIADHGNRDFGETSNEYGADGKLKSTLRETISIEQVAEALKEKSLTYLPIAVAGAFNATANGKFREQTSGLMRRVNIVPGELTLTYDESTGLDPVAGRSAKILARLREAIELSRKSAQALEARIICERSKAVKACSDVEALRRSDSWIGRFAAKMTEEMLPKNQIDNIFSRVETVTALHFPPVHDGNDVFTYWLAIEPGDLSSLVGLAQKVCDRFGQRAAKSTLYQLVEQEIGISAGEKNKSLADQYVSVGDLMEKRFFIPAAFVMDFLRKSWEDVEADLANPEGYKAMQKQVCRSAFLLGRVLAGKRVDESSMVWNPNTNSYTAKSERDFQWRIKPDSGVELFYFPLNYLK
jgi:hypothetical protein